MVHIVVSLWEMCILTQNITNHHNMLHYKIRTVSEMHIARIADYAVLCGTCKKTV